jgi:lambda family phage portal protein
MGLGQFIDGMIAPFSPGTALRRTQERDILLRYYDAARPGRLRKKQSDNRPQNQQVREASQSLIAQARHLDRNHDIAKGILNVLVAYVIGRGLHIEPLVKNKKGEFADDINKRISELLSDWGKFPEVTNTYSFPQIQRMAFRTMLRDGEIFSKLVSGIRDDLDHISTVPFSIEMIETDYLPYGVDAPVKDAVDGITRDSWGRAKSYHVAKRNVDEHLAQLFRSVDYSVIDADDMVHCKLTDRFMQNRGVTIFASVMTRLEDIKDYEESERIAAKVAASLSAYIKKGSPDMYDSSMYEYEDRDLRMEPGKILEIGVGEDAGIFDSKRPNTNLETFRQGQVRAMASGTMAGYSSISKNYESSYTGHRKEDAEQSIHYGILRNNFVSQFIEPIYRRFISTAIAARQISFAGVDMSTAYDFESFGESMPELDPWREGRTDVEYINARVKSRTMVQRERNINPLVVNKQIEMEAAADKKARDAGLIPPLGGQANNVATGNQTNNPD